MLQIEQNYANGIPQTAVEGFNPRGLAWHWTAGGKGRAGALQTIQHFINTRYTVNASYHLLFWVEHKIGHIGCITYAMWIVPVTSASHSLAPSQAFVPKTGSSLEKARFTEVHRILIRDSDPNADVWALSYCGMPADLKADLGCAVFRADLVNLAKQLIAHPTYITDRPHFGHGWIQPSTRYEMDQVGLDFISMLYGEVTSLPQEEDMQFWRPVQQDWWTANGTVFYDGAGNKKYFTSRERVRSTAESSEGRYRLVRYGSRELLVVDARGSDKDGPGLAPIAGTRIPTSGFGFPPLEIKEVIKEVPTGITPEDVKAAKDAAADAERERLAAAEANRIKNL